MHPRKTDRKLPSLVPRLALQVALTVLAQAVLLAFLAAVLPGVTSYVANFLVNTPAGALKALVIDKGEEQVVTARLLSTQNLPAEPVLEGDAIAVFVPAGVTAVEAEYPWPEPWGREVQGPVLTWLAGPTAPTKPSWHSLGAGNHMYILAAVPVAEPAGWVVVARDSTESLDTWAMTIPGALWFSVEEAQPGMVIASAASFREFVSGHVASRMMAPQPLGRPYVMILERFTVAMSRTVRTGVAIVLVSVLVILGIQLISLPGTYSHILRPVQRLVSAVRLYAQEGDWIAPEVSFREQEDLVRAFSQVVASRLEAEAQSRSLARELSAFLDAMPAEAMLFGLDQRVRIMNRAMVNRVGRSADQVLGLDITSLLEPARAEEHTQAVHAALETGRVQSFEEVVTEADGSATYMRTVTAPWFNTEGKVEGFVTLSMDVTQVKQMEQRLADAHQAEMLGRLAGGVAHVINNVLTAVIGSAELALLTSAEDDPLRPDLEQIRAAAERGAMMGKQLVFLSNRSRGTDGPTDVRAVLEDLAPAVREIARDRAKVDFAIEPGLYPVLMDEGEVRQIVLSLLLNAVEAVTGNNGLLRLEARQVRPTHEALIIEPLLAVGPVVRLRIVDNGAGIPPDVADHVFEPFFTTKGASGGRGLGLATVRSIVRNHGGAITFRSAVGRGAMFDVYLPAAQEGGAPEVDVSVAPVSMPVQRQGIIVVDDDPAVLGMTQRMLVAQGFDVSTADCAESALAVLREADPRPDLILTDIVMPGQNGIDFAVEAQSLYPAIKVLLMSGYAGDQAQVAEQGFHLLWKPFSLQELMDALTAVTNAGQPGESAADGTDLDLLP